eukprot:2768900-Amphidinium_carterae.1
MPITLLKVEARTESVLHHQVAAAPPGCSVTGHDSPFPFNSEDIVVDPPRNSVDPLMQCIALTARPSCTKRMNMEATCEHLR